MTELKRFLAVMIAGLFLSSCAGTTVQESWSRDDSRKEVKNVYIIGFVRDDISKLVFDNSLGSRMVMINGVDLVRISLENSLVKGFAAEGIKSIASHSDISKSLMPEVKPLLQRIRDKNCDTILLVKMNDSRAMANFTTWGSYRYQPRQNFKSDQDYLRLPYDNIWNRYLNGYRVLPPQKRGASLVALIVESMMFDLQTSELIWSARMETDLEQNLDEMLQKFVDESVENLKEAGFI